MWLVIFLLVIHVCVVAQEPPPAHRETVVVTGTYTPVKEEEFDRPITIWNIPQLRLTSNTFVDLLRLDSSVDLRQRSPNGVQADLSVRGGTFGQTLVLLDGMRLNDSQSGHHNLDLPVPLEAVERIELLKGLGSTFHGSDAIGGVVNVIPYQPEATELRLRGAIGNWGVNQQRVTAATVWKNVTQVLSASRDFSTGFMPNRDYRNLSLASITRVRSRLGHTSVLLAHNDRPFGADKFYGERFNSWERTKGWWASARQELGEQTDVSFAFRRHTDLFVLYRDRPEPPANRHAVESFEGAIRRRERLPGHSVLSYGAETYRDDIVSNNLGVHGRQRSAFYAALDARALRRFSLSAGLRQEITRSFDVELNPTVSASAWLSSQWRLRGSVSRAFRLPSYTDLYYRDPANIGSPTLRPERAWNYEGGLDWQAGAWTAAATVFQRRERDGIDYVRASELDIWRATNFQRLRFNGVEARVAARVRHGEIDLRYTGLHGARSGVQNLQSKYVFNYPVHSAVASWIGSLPGGVTVRTRVGALSRLGRDPYAVWDIYAARSRGRVHPFLQLTNVTATTYQEILGVAMPGRGIVAGIEWAAFGTK